MVSNSSQQRGGSWYDDGAAAAAAAWLVWSPGLGRPSVESLGHNKLE